MLWIGIMAVVALGLIVLLFSRSGSQGRASTTADPGAKPQGDRARPAGHISDPPPAPPGSGVGDLAPEALRAPPVHVAPPKDNSEAEIQFEFGERDDIDETTGPIPIILVTAVGRTDAGKRRKHNEDSYLVLPEETVFVIADGMGGYAAGEVASQLAVDTIDKAFKTKTFAGTPDPMRPRRGDELVRAVEMANSAILSQARENEAQAGMGTTLVAARFALNKQRVYIAHVGDSRLYRLRGSELRQLTTDHTLGSLGITGPSAAKLTRAVGIGDEVEVDLLSESAEPGDHYILCSDGLSKMVPDDLVTKILLDDENLERACQALIQTANDAGGRDNVTVILIRVEHIGLANAASTSAAT